MTKQELIKATFEAIDNNYHLVGEVLKATNEGKLPGLTIGCTIDYHTDTFYKMTRYPRRYKVWDFNYHMNCILETNTKAERYLETGIWSN